MNTIKTIKQQKEWLDKNWQYKSLSHKWSTRGYGNSKILDSRGSIIGKASGCGYDRLGAALGEAMMFLFHDEILTLAKRHCKGTRCEYKKAPNLYGLFYNSKENKAWVDGACGSNCMITILNAIGFDLIDAGSTNIHSNTGQNFFMLMPLSKENREWIKNK